MRGLWSQASSALQLSPFPRFVPGPILHPPPSPPGERGSLMAAEGPTGREHRNGGQRGEGRDREGGRVVLEHLRR